MSRGFRLGSRIRDGYHYGLRSTLSVIAYNTKIVPAEEAPKTWKDLLDPKWRGKLVTAHPGYSGVISTHVLALVNLYGWDFFKQLAQNKLMLVQSANDPAQVVASGERPIAVDGSDYFFYQTKKKGNPIEIVYPKEGVPLIVSPTAITASRRTRTPPNCSPTSSSVGRCSRSSPTAKDSTPDTRR